MYNLVLELHAQFKILPLYVARNIWIITVIIQNVSTICIIGYNTIKSDSSVP